MSKRLQVVLDDAELARFEQAATQAGITLSEWVRQSLRATERGRSARNPGAKLAAIGRAAAHRAAPAPDIDQMLSEIEAGYRPGA